MGLFEDATGFNVEHLVQQLGQGKNADEVRTEIVKCADDNTNKDTNCIWAYRGFKCFREAHLDLIKLSVKKD